MERVRKGRLGRSVALFVVGLALLDVVPGVAGLPFYLDEALRRAVAAAAVAGLVALLGGARSLAPRAAGLRTALREGAYPLGLAAGLCALELASLLASVRAGEAAPSAAWATDLLGMALLCVGVGAFEELLFRSLLLGGMLSRFGDTRRGVLGSALASSVVFGLAHVSYAIGTADALAIAQMALKTAQVTCFSLLLSGIFVRTRGVWGAALVHGLSDFLLMAPLALVGGGEDLLGSYVAVGEGPAAALLGAVMVALYVVAVLLYAPAAVRGWRLLAAADVPEPGPLACAWEPRDVRPPAGRGPGDGRPVPPAGLGR
ncbi:CPBP family intramembrane metalloprotease [Olsenella uli]|uniref:CPBP family intramembrane glutamic endopeptidase n=1 Tax=Olsenella uli TaxID=133926 RepID=UPI00195EEBC2|nr:CPBP family intramembrane glutamic endopeptidase [Olsenella uli]MBM6816124.1 CPBP family intramembrane metalloprotease [Olsenella uli]